MKKIIGMFIDIKTAIGMLFEIEREYRKSMYATSNRDALPTEAGL